KDTNANSPVTKTEAKADRADDAKLAREPAADAPAGRPMTVLDALPAKSLNVDGTGRVATVGAGGGLATSNAAGATAHHEALRSMAAADEKAKETEAKPADGFADGKKAGRLENAREEAKKQALEKAKAKSSAKLD